MSNMPLRDLLLARISPAPKADISQSPGAVVAELEPHSSYTEPNVRPQGTLLRGSFVYTERFALIRDDSGAYHPCSIQSTTFQPYDAAIRPIEIYRRYNQKDQPTDLATGKATIAKMREDFSRVASTENVHRVDVAQNQARMSV